MLINRTGGGSENLDIQLTDQRALLDQIHEILPYKGAPENITPEKFGCTKMAIDEILFDANQPLNTQLPHSLGEIPKVAFLLAQNSTKVDNELDKAFFLYYGDAAANKYMLYSTWKSGNCTVTGDDDNTHTNAYLIAHTGITHMDYGNPWYGGNVKYTLITMA